MIEKSLGTKRATLNSIFRRVTLFTPNTTLTKGCLCVMICTKVENLEVKIVLVTKLNTGDK